MRTINLKCNVNSLGIGIWSTQFANSLSKLYDLRLDASLNYAPEGLEDFPGLANHVSELHNKPTDPNAPTISLGQAHPSYIANYGTPKIIYPIFETTKLSPTELQLMNEADRVWVPSQWAKEICRQNMVKSHDKVQQIDVVPLGVDPNFYCPQDRGQSQLGIELASRRAAGYKVFFSGGKFEKRKGHYLVLNALDKLLSNEKICLLVHWDNPFIKDYGQFITSVLEQYGFDLDKNCAGINRYTNGNVHLYTIPRKSSFSYVRNLYAEADFGLFPAFAEGWNLPLIEMISMGKPCITTYYSAHTEFLDKDNLLLITAEGGNMVPAQDGVWFNGNRGDWFEPTLQSVEDKVRMALAIDQTNYEKISKQARTNVSAFTWDNAAAKAAQLLGEI